MPERLFIGRSYKINPEYESILMGESEYGFSNELVSPLPPNTSSRNTPEYIKWVQSSLNQIMGLKLAVDGIKGPLTRSAIRSFQTQKNLTVDGIVGPITEAAIKAALTSIPVRPLPPAPLTAEEQSAVNELGPLGIFQFYRLRSIILGYSGVALREADRGMRVLLKRGVFKALPTLLPGITEIADMTTLSPGWSVTTAKPLLVGNILYNLAFPETINQGGTDRLGGTPDPTCFSASTQMLLAWRFPATYVRYVKQLVTNSSCIFAGGDRIGPLIFVSTSLYKSLDSVLLQTAFDTYFRTIAIVGGTYKAGDELKVHRQVFGLNYPPKFATSGSARITAFRKAFVPGGSNARRPEIINLCTQVTSTCGNHSVVLTKVQNGRVFFYNPWANEEEKNTMFGTASVTTSGNGERPAESSMSQADFEGQLVTVFHN